MSRHQEIFVELYRESKYSAKQISAWSGVHESTLSRFINNKTDMKAGDFFKLLASLPKDFQKQFWNRFHDSKDDWRSLLLSASPKDLKEICNLIGDLLVVNKQSKVEKRVIKQIDREKVPA